MCTFDEEKDIHMKSISSEENAPTHDLNMLSFDSKLRNQFVP
jgi:hypothetical protein